MHPNLGRDIPLLLGFIAILVGVLRTSIEPRAKDPDEPQWMCRVMFYFVGTVLIGFGVLGHYSPY